MNLPPIYTCFYCSLEVRLSAADTCRRVSGWSKSKAGQEVQQVLLADELGTYAHLACVNSQKWITKKEPTPLF